MAMSDDELVELKAKIVRLRMEADEAEQKLKKECTHPQDYHDFDSLGSECTLCGGDQDYFLGPLLQYDPKTGEEVA